MIIRSFLTYWDVAAVFILLFTNITAQNGISSLRRMRNFIEVDPVSTKNEPHDNMYGELDFGTRNRHREKQMTEHDNNRQSQQLETSNGKLMTTSTIDISLKSRFEMQRFLSDLFADDFSLSMSLSISMSMSMSYPSDPPLLTISPTPLRNVDSPSPTQQQSNPPLLTKSPTVTMPSIGTLAPSLDGNVIGTFNPTMSEITDAPSTISVNSLSPTDEKVVDTLRPTMFELSDAPSPVLVATFRPTEEKFDDTLSPTISESSDAPSLVLVDTLSPTDSAAVNTVEPSAIAQTELPTIIPLVSVLPTLVPSVPTAPTINVTAIPTVGSSDGCLAKSREEGLLDILRNVSSVDDLLNPASPQGAAFNWMLVGDPLLVDPCTYPTVEQRYSLAVFYESTGGLNWRNNAGWLSGDNECLWFGITCNSDGFVESMGLSKYSGVRLRNF